MKRVAAALFVSLALAALPGISFASFLEEPPANPSLVQKNATFEVVFSVPGSLSPAIVDELGTAKKSIRMAAREFTSKPVSDALVKAARGGVDFKAVLNRKTNEGIDSAAQFLLAMDIFPHLTKAADALHANYIIVDGRDIIIGNIAGLADEVEEKNNAASVIIIRNAPELAAKYTANWQALWNASEEMKKPKD